MSNKFRNDLIDNNLEFRILFNSLMDSGELSNYPQKLLDIIARDKSSIKINNEPLAFKDLFHQDKTGGLCKVCAIHFVMLFDKLCIYSEAVSAVNDFFTGTSGSSYGGHWYVEVHFPDGVKCIDTSLEVMGSREAFLKLGHKVVRKYDIDTLFKEDAGLIDYYDEMIVNKNKLY